MFCAKCGNSEISTKFCPKCGAPVALPHGNTQIAQTAQPRPAPPSTNSLNSKVQPAPIVRNKSVPPPPRSVPPPPTAPQPKPPVTDKYLDGSVFMPASEYSTASSTGATDKPKVKIQPVFKTYSPGETGMFGSMYYMIIDPETFFTRADFTKEVGTVFMVIFFVNIVRGIGSLIMKFLLLNKMPQGKELDAVMLGSVFAFIYPFLVSVLGMIVMTLMYRAFASWKRIFGIYAFASVPYLISFLPLFGLFSFIFFVYYARKGFENVFGLDSFASLLFALGLPILFWSVTLFIFGSAIILGGK